MSDQSPALVLYGDPDSGHAIKVAFSRRDEKTFTNPAGSHSSGSS